MQDKYKWLSFYKTVPTWNEQTSIYFRHTPYPYEWIVLIMMSMLNFINVLFINKVKEEELNIIAYENLRNRYPKVMLGLLRIRNYFSQYMIVIVICTMFYYISKAQSNIINLGFFVLNMVNFAFVAKGDNKISTNKNSRKIAEIIKVYSALMLMLNIGFILFVGEKEKPNLPNSLDQQLKNWYPFIYDNLDIIGLRWH